LILDYNHPNIRLHQFLAGTKRGSYGVHTL
jgi:hypothetical protein